MLRGFIFFGPGAFAAGWTCVRVDGGWRLCAISPERNGQWEIGLGSQGRSRKTRGLG